MNRSFIAPTTYFLQEGRENLDECLKIAFQAAAQQGIGKVVIFTAFGEGIKRAQENFCSLDEYAHIRLVGVTFPAGKMFTDDHKRPYESKISQEVETLLERCKIPLVRAHLPFDPIEPSATLRMKIGDDLNLLGEAFNMFCGSMSLCVQAVALACDAGYVGNGEHVIALTSDTAILAKAAVTRSMLSQLIIREILCKPAILTIGRHEIAPPPKVVKGGARKLKNPHKLTRSAGKKDRDEN
jgi:hypothetical protein